MLICIYFFTHFILIYCNTNIHSLEMGVGRPTKFRELCWNYLEKTSKSGLVRLKYCANWTKKLRLKQQFINGVSTIVIFFVFFSYISVATKMSVVKLGDYYICQSLDIYLTFTFINVVLQQNDITIVGKLDKL